MRVWDTESLHHSLLGECRLVNQWDSVLGSWGYNYLELQLSLLGVYSKDSPAYCRHLLIRGHCCSVHISQKLQIRYPDEWKRKAWFDSLISTLFLDYEFPLVFPILRISSRSIVELYYFPYLNHSWIQPFSGTHCIWGFLWHHIKPLEGP